MIRFLRFSAKSICVLIHVFFFFFRLIEGLVDECFSSLASWPREWYILGQNIWQLVSAHISIVSSLLRSESQSSDVGYTTSSCFLEILVWGPNHIQ